ncbi:MAG: nitroreductase family protein [Acetatifactor sp.]
MKNVLEAIAKRSSTRAYTDEKLTDEEIQLLITAGLQAPTARNKQEFHISVLDGSNSLLKEINQEKRRLALGDPSKFCPGTADAKDNFYHGAPTVFLISAEEDFPYVELDSGIVAENIALAAEGMELGSLIIGVIRGALRGEKRFYFEKRAEIPKGHIFTIAVAVGHKAAEKAPHTFIQEKQVTFVK